MNGARRYSEPDKNIRRTLLIYLLAFSKLLYSEIVQVKPVGPGITYYHDIRSEGPWHMYVLEIDLTSEWNQVKTVKANDLLEGLERTSSMAVRNDREAHRVVGAINGDFYASGGVTVGAQILQGVLLKEPHPSRSVFGITSQKLPVIEVVAFEGKLVARDDSTLTINGINRTRESNSLILYNRYFGNRTQTNYWGTEIKAHYIAEPPLINDSVKVVVVSKDSIQTTGHGNNTISQNGIVLSGHGTARDFLNSHVFVGDTVWFSLGLPPTRNPLLELIGGTPRMIRDGVRSVEWRKEEVGQSFSYDRHPRTAAGMSEDSSKVFLFTVDGRQPGYSVGMSLFELADYMLQWNVYQGVNLDGGGSTTMIVRGKVVNTPSDAGGERSVANAFMVVSTAPTGSLAILELAPGKVYVIAGSEIQFSVEGLDQYYNPVSVDQDSVVFSCDSTVGTISATGLFTADTTGDSGYVYVSLGDIHDSAKIYLTDVGAGVYVYQIRTKAHSEAKKMILLH